jgi:hypothetical protein
VEEVRATYGTVVGVVLGVVVAAGADRGSVVVTKGVGGALPVDAGVAATVSLGIKGSTLLHKFFTCDGKRTAKKLCCSLLINNPSKANE